MGVFMENEMQEGQEETGDATALVQSVGDGLVKLSDMLAKSPGVTDQDMAQMEGVLTGFVDLVEKKLGGSAPGEDLPEEEMPADMGAVPMQQGRNGIPMGPNTRQ